MSNHESPMSSERQEAEAAARRRHLIVTVGLMVVTAIVYLGLVLIIVRELPATMATHFGLSGQPDAFMSTPVALLMQGVAVLGVPLALLAVFGAGQWWRGEHARSMSATIAGLSAGLTTLFVSLTIAHVGVADANDVTLSGSTALLVLAVGAIVGLLAAAVLPKPLPRLPAQPVAPMKIAASDRVSWFGKARTGTALFTAIGVGILVVVVGAVSTGVLWLWLLVLLLVVLALGITSFGVTVDARGVTWRAARCGLRTAWGN